MDEKLKREYFERNYENYDQWYEDHPREYSEQVEFLEGIIPEGKGIEIGVGTGRFASALGIEYGIDYLPVMVEESNRRGIKAVLSDATDLPFPDNSFDFSFSIVTMCFLDRPREALIESRRIARTVVTVILDRDCEYVRNIIRKRIGFYEFATFYNEKELVDMYRNAGFTEINVITKDLVTTDGQQYRLVAVIGK